MSKRVSIFAIVLAAFALEAQVPALAFAGIDSCYKKCYLDTGSTLSSGRKRACRRACEATPRYQCEKRCWDANRDASVKANACITTRC